MSGIIVGRGGNHFATENNLQTKVIPVRIVLIKYETTETEMCIYDWKLMLVAELTQILLKVQWRGGVTQRSGG